MRILLLGDTHGNLLHTENMLDVALKHQIETIIQLGDFGFWPHMGDFHKIIDNECSLKKIDFYWLDGNHENFDALDLAVNPKSKYPQKMGNRLTYLPRGSVHKFGEVPILVLGGAYSIDKAWRTPGTTWWKQEMITPEQVHVAKSHGKVPIMLTHDMPDEAFKVQWENSGYKADVQSESNRLKISEVMRAVEPKLLVHGHMHTRYDQQIGPTHVVGLACDGYGEDAWWILDTDEYLDK